MCSQPLSLINEMSIPTKESVREESTQDHANVIMHKYEPQLEGNHTIPAKRSKI